ncbi:MAG: DNA replication/repair protein RecF [Bacteroidota bacterium]
MYLQKLTVTNFKNYEQAEFSFSEKINCLVGDNGEGKTNMLDAIFYLSFCKSYFNPLDTQNIRHGEDFFAIHGYYQRNGDSSDQVSCIQKRNHKKQFRLNKKDYDRLADHIGLFPLVMVSPSDADLINLGSEERRKYFDGVISQFDKVYLEDLLNYNKAVQHRNALLRFFAESHSFQQSSLDIWNEQMVMLGSKIHKKREIFLESFIPLFQEFFEVISEGKEKVEIHYESQLHDHDFAGILNEALSRDLALKYSTVGVHKDDMLFNLSGYPVKKYGSQGQQKSFLISLKLAQFEFTRRIKDFKPVLLFDDIFDKLDDRRVAQLIRLVGENNFGQVFITDTKYERIKSIFASIEIDHMIYRISNGKPDIL